MPSMNPDGYEYTRNYDRMWRKTRYTISLFLLYISYAHKFYAWINQWGLWRNILMMRLSHCTGGMAAKIFMKFCVLYSFKNQRTSWQLVKTLIEKSMRLHVYTGCNVMKKKFYFWTKNDTVYSKLCKKIKHDMNPLNVDWEKSSDQTDLSFDQ